VSRSSPPAPCYRVNDDVWCASERCGDAAYLISRALVNHNWYKCFNLIPLLSLPVVGASLLAMRYGAPMHGSSNRDDGGR
jgi:Negative regulator of sigma F